MDWLIDVQSRIKRKNQVLFAKDSPFLHDLSALLAEQNHRTVVLWALELADETSETLRGRYPGETRLQEAVETSRAWAAGRVKMRQAQRAILRAHAVAKEIDSPEDIALCHAVGQACGVVHTAGHAIGFPVYELTAIIRRLGVPACKAAVEKRKRHYMDRLPYWREHCDDPSREWADFLIGT